MRNLNTNPNRDLELAEARAVRAAQRAREQREVERAQRVREAYEAQRAQRQAS